MFDTRLLDYITVVNDRTYVVASVLNDTIRYGVASERDGAIALVSMRSFSEACEEVEQVRFAGLRLLTVREAAKHRELFMTFAA